MRLKIPGGGRIAPVRGNTKVLVTGAYSFLFSPCIGWWNTVIKSSFTSCFLLLLGRARGTDGRWKREVKRNPRDMTNGARIRNNTLETRDKILRALEFLVFQEQNTLHQTSE